VKRFSWTMSALIVILAGAQPLSALDERFHFFASLGTGPTNGVYYPVGGTICTIVNEDLLKRRTLLKRDNARFRLQCRSPSIRRT
jgi:TRAP-type uncharacterized transport system substrate-binding protein